MEVWRGCEEGLKIVILNPGIIIGSGNWERSAVLFNMAYKKNPITTKGTTAFVDAEDVAKIAIKLMTDKIINNQRYIIVSENLPYKQVTKDIASFFNRNKIIIIPNYLLLFGVKISSFLKIFSKNLDFFSYSAYKGLTDKSFYSNKKIKETLTDFNFKPINESIKKHAQNYLNYKNEGKRF